MKKVVAERFRNIRMRFLHEEVLTYEQMESLGRLFRIFSERAQAILVKTSLLDDFDANSPFDEMAIQVDVEEELATLWGILKIELCNFLGNEYESILFEEAIEFIAELGAEGMLEYDMDQLALDSILFEAQFNAILENPTEEICEFFLSPLPTNSNDWFEE